jgi:hypothetical protein
MGSRVARDRGLFQIGRATRWMAAGMVLGGGVLSAAVAEALPGHSAHRSGTAPAPTTPSTTPPDATGAGAPSSDLTVPQQAPQPVSTQPVVNSGGS